MDLPEHYAALARRIGRERLGVRVLRQATHWARLTHQGEGVFQVERVVPIDAVVAAVLRLCGLAARARRNFLDVRVVERECWLRRLPSAFDGFRLMQITDLHLDLDPALVEVVQRLVGLTPHDAAVITGDYRNGTDNDFASSVALTTRILPGLAKERWGTLGNHDFIEMVPLLEASGLPILLNENAVIRRGGEELWIAGVDDAHFYRTHDLGAAASGIPRNACRILLSHTPELADAAAAEGYDLMLSGHTHGGQICLPGGRALVVPARGLPRALIRGAWRVGGMEGYTSPGTGSCGVAARFNCPPEITVHVLRRGEPSRRNGT